MDITSASELTSAIVISILIVVLLGYAHKTSNYVVSASLVPLVIQLFYYIALFFNVEPISSSEIFRVLTIRPSSWVFFMLMAVFFVNGTINKKIDTLVTWIRNAFHHK